MRNCKPELEFQPCPPILVELPAAGIGEWAAPIRQQANEDVAPEDYLGEEVRHDEEELEGARPLLLFFRRVSRLAVRTCRHKWKI